MVLSAYCKQQIVQLYFERRISCERVAQVVAEGFQVPKQTVWATVRKYKAHGTISRLSGSGRPFKLTCERGPLIFFPFSAWKLTQ